MVEAASLPVLESVLESITEMSSPPVNGHIITTLIIFCNFLIATRVEKLQTQVSKQYIQLHLKQSAKRKLSFNGLWVPQYIEIYEGWALSI